MSKILIVDDEVETLNVLSTFLEIIGHHPLTTPDPRLAISMAEREHPDCVLLDVMMPEIDGFSLCKQMRMNSATKTLPIMFITAYAPLDLEDRRRDAGGDMVLMKPFGLDALTSMLEGIMVAHPIEEVLPPALPITISMDVAPIIQSGTQVDDSAWVFRRNANTGVFSSTLRDFLANMSDR
jgi:DNA-binding response OmpR family regulator